MRMVQGLIRDRLGQDRDSQLSKDGERQSAKQRQRLNGTVDSQKSECLPSGEPVMDSQGWFGIENQSSERSEIGEPGQAELSRTGTG